MNRQPAIHCPHCGAPLRLIKADGFTTSERPGLFKRAFTPRTTSAPRTTTSSHTAGHRFESAAPWAAGAADDYPRSETAAMVEELAGSTKTIRTYRPRDVASDVMAPATWAVIGGALIGLTAIPVAVANRWTWYVPLAIWLGSSTVLFFAAGWRILTDDSCVEHQEDLKLATPQRAAPEPPPRQERALRVQVGTDDDQRRQYADLPDTRAFWDLAVCVTKGDPPKPFTEETARWCGMPIDVPSYAIIDEMGFRQIRDLFLRRGWAVWKNEDHHQQGVDLLAAGKAVLRDVAAAPPPPAY